MPNLVTCLHENEDSTSINEDSNINILANQDSNIDVLANKDSNINILANQDLNSNINILTNEKQKIEFGCIYVFTCSNSCWDNNGVVREEFAVIQADPDDELLRKC